ncbi:MAG: hypothetical protein ABH860_03555 [bacterium]
MNDKIKTRYFYLSALFIGGAAWTHNEGLMLFAAMILTLLIYFIGQIISKKAKYTEMIIGIIAFFAVYTAVTGPFKALIKYFNLNQLWVSNFWQLFYFLPNLNRIPTILGYLCYELFLDTYLWMYFWIFFFILLFINRRNILNTNLIYVFLFVFFSFAMIFEVFFISNVGMPLEGIVGLIKLNLDRAMLIIPPSAGFLIFASLFKQEN